MWTPSPQMKSPSSQSKKGKILLKQVNDSERKPSGCMVDTHCTQLIKY